MRQYPVGLLGLCLLLCATAAATDYPLGLSARDERGCRLGHGSVEGATLHLMSAAHSDPGFPAGQALAILRRALAAGCDIHEADALGLSPLNAALLYNDAALAAFLLEHGADPAQPIVSPKAALNGLDSRRWLTLLERRQPQHDRRALRRLLERHAAARQR